MYGAKGILSTFMDSVQAFSLRRKRIRPIRHPGAILESEWLEPLGLSVYEFAIKWELNPYVLYEIIEGQRPLDVTTSSKLQQAFNVPACYWLQAQRDYDRVVRERERHCWVNDSLI